MKTKPAYLEKLDGIKRQFEIRDNKTFCDLLVNPKKHEDDYESYARTAAGSELKSVYDNVHFSNLTNLGKAIDYAFRQRGVLTPIEQSDFSDEIGLTDTYVSETVFPILIYLRLMKKEGENFKLTPKVWKSVIK